MNTIFHYLLAKWTKLISSAKMYKYCKIMSIFVQPGLNKIKQLNKLPLESLGF